MQDHRHARLVINKAEERLVEEVVGISLISKAF